MSDGIKEKIEALDYAIYICDTRKNPFKHVTYNAACDDIKIFLEAAKERLQTGEDMRSYAVVQTPTEK